LVYILGFFPPVRLLPHCPTAGLVGHLTPPEKVCYRLLGFPPPSPCKKLSQAAPRPIECIFVLIHAGAPGTSEVGLFGLSAVKVGSQDLTIFFFEVSPSPPLARNTASGPVTHRCHLRDVRKKPHLLSSFPLFVWDLPPLFSVRQHVRWLSCSGLGI